MDTSIQPDWSIRLAVTSDAPQVIEAVRLLLAELRGIPDTTLPEGSEEIFLHYIHGKLPGAIYVAEQTRTGLLLGCVSASVQEAIHVGSRYALIQELWVHPEFRSHAIGAALIQAIEQYCSQQHLDNLEVCLPSKRFIHLEKTYHFYEKAGFKEIGSRMRKGVE